MYMQRSSLDFNRFELVGLNADGEIMHEIDNKDLIKIRTLLEKKEVLVGKGVHSSQCRHIASRTYQLINKAAELGELTVGVLTD